MSFLRKLEAVPGSGQSDCMPDPEFQETFPAMSEFMTAPSYPDGSAREKATVSVFFEDGVFKACLNERDRGLVLFVSEAKFACLFEALELLLQGEHVPWRISKQVVAKGGQKAKKGT